MAKREETERMTETLREEQKTSSRKQTLEEDIENLSESLHVKAEGIVKVQHRVLPTGSPESRKGGLKGRGERGENKSRGFSPNKRLFEINVRRKEKLAEDKITEAEQDNHPIYVLEKNHIRRIWTG